jgi:hypothetical protein
MATQNDSVKDLMQILLDQHAALLAKLDDADDSNLRKAILAEAQEILHRINLTQNLLFVALTPALDAALTAVKGSDAALKQDLGDIADTAAFIDKITGFLGYVDQAIDIAKKVAAV